MTAGTKGLKIAILGCGFIGTAVLQGLVRASSTHRDGASWTYIASVRSDSSVNRLRNIFQDAQNNVEIVKGETARVVKDADVILLGVQPHDLKNLINSADFRQYVSGRIVISMVAGESVENIKKSMPSADTSVSRAIPTIGAKIGDSVTLLSDFSPEQSAQKNIVEGIFSRIGDIHYVPENLMNSATALGAVCHALTIEAVEAATDSSVASGIPRDIAQSIAARCLQSAGNLLASDMTPETLKSAMSTPSGITLNSTVRLGQARGNISDTVRFAINYANGMSG